MPRRKNVDIINPPNEGDTRREGKQNIPWQEDAEILQRLSEVAILMVKGKRAWEIAKETKVSIETARRDIARVRELWKEDAKDRITNSKDSAIAQYTAVQSQAWEDLKKASKRSPNRAAFMRVILEAQNRIDKVTGIADPIGGPFGGPIPVEVVDMEAVRKKRWKSIAPNLKVMERKQDDTADSK